MTEPHKVVTNGTYKEQFQRVERYFQRFTAINNGVPHRMNDWYYTDDVHAFFVNCYTLKDWVKNDETAGPLGDAVEAFVNNSRELRICADLANGMKHLTLLNKQRSGISPEFGAKEIHMKIGEAPEPMISLKYIVASSDGDLDAYEIAKSCMEQWAAFLPGD